MDLTLKRARVIISLLVSGLFIWVFLDTWSRFSEILFRFLLPTQIVPALLEGLYKPSLSLLVLLLVILLTLLFGRIYCSTLCPLGTFQDIIIFLHRKINRSRRSIFRYYKPFAWLRWTLLLLAAGSLLTGQLFLLILLDPYSLIGRLITQGIRPWFVAGFNRMVDGLQSIRFYEILPVDAVPHHSFAFYFTLVWILLMVWLVYKKNRIYCNTLCPAGIFLGLVSAFSLFRIKIRRDPCTLCGDCVKTCKAGCIDLKRLTVDVTRCIGCQNCIVSCSESAIGYYNHYRFSGQAPRPLARPSRPGRRNVLKWMLGAPLLLAADLAKNKTPSHTQADLPKRRAITPPGSLGIPHFNAYCTACHLCVSHCPTQVLQPSSLEYGMKGMFQPMMDFPNKFCNYDCIECSRFCPTGAIVPLTVEKKKRVQIGRVRFIEHLCVVITKGTACGACSEHCPTKACDMVPYKGKLTLPKVDPSICIGCGACEHACPTQPKSIVVDENYIHLVAETPRPKPVKTNVNIPIETYEDFPF